MSNQTTINKPTQDEINATLWAACDSFRGAIDSSSYKQYILVFMFLKYLSDYWKDKQVEIREKYGDDEELIRRKLSRERFILSERCTFDYISANKNDAKIGEIIDKALEQIEEENKLKIEGVFRNISFNSEVLGETKDRNARLRNLISDFENPKLDFRPSVIGKEDIIGNAYMYLIERFAESSGKKGGEFYTPHEVSVLLAKLIKPKKGSRIYDPTCGSGSLLITVAEEVKDTDGKPSKDFAIYGQESNGETRALCKMNMFLHELDSAKVEWGDTINNPKLKEGDALMKFDVVVANPPFSLDKWGAETAADDHYKRFTRGIPPRTKGDYAFVLHMIASANASGRVGVIVPHGVLFRGSSEGIIRQKLVEENLLEAVIGLPSNLFFGTSIPAAILIFNKAKGANQDVIFIDGSKHFEAGKRQNKLRPSDIEQVITVYENYKKGNYADANVEKYSSVVSQAQIAENDYNLNIPRYVDTFESEETIDVATLQTEINTLETELASVKTALDEYLKELEFIN